MQTMMEDNKTPGVFARKEMKYVLDPCQADRLMAVAAGKLKPSDFASSQVRSLYYDTPGFNLINRSIEAKAFKEKLRLRVYGCESSPDTASFIELKEKYKGIVYKRRIRLPLQMSVAFLEDPENGPSIAEDLLGTWRDSQIAEEIKQFMMMEGPLDPSILTSCNRISYEDAEGSGLRMTFDSVLKGKVGASSIDDSDGAFPLLDEGFCVMEIKCSSAVPIWLSDALTEAKAYKRSFSKCGTAYKLEKGFPVC